MRRSLAAARSVPAPTHVRNRRKNRGDVVAEHKRHKLALREEARALTADLKINRLFTTYRRRYFGSVAFRAIHRSDARLQLRSMSLFFKRMCDVEAAQAMRSSPTSSCLELSPAGRRLASTRHMDERTPPNGRGAKRAENRQQKPRGGRSRPSLTASVIAIAPSPAPQSGHTQIDPMRPSLTLLERVRRAMRAQPQHYAL